MFYMSLPICLLVIGAALCSPEQVQNDPGPQGIPDPTALVVKRSAPGHPDINRRTKRKPGLYNFGLGKRSRPYSFGLGKRSTIEDGVEEQYTNDIDRETLAEIYDQYDDLQGYEKRARPYSFGLGKRFSEDETAEEKRARMYDFGLGKRLPLYNFGLGKRTRNYNFGLGKRLSSKFNFGLGKRERDMHRYNFGLGKRSDDTIDDDNYLEE